MTDFSDLRSAYSNYLAAHDGHWGDLNIKAISLQKGLAKYLGVSGQGFTRDGKVEPYVQIGFMENGSFKPVLGTGFLAERLNLSFTIKITVDEDINSSPKNSFLIDLSIGKDGDGYRVNLQKKAEISSFSVPKSFSFDDQKDIHEAIAQDIVRRMDASIFP